MTAPASPSVPAARRRRRRVAPWVIGVVLTLLVALLVGLGLLARDALTARAALTDALDALPPVEDALRTGDGARARAALAVVQPLTAEAREATEGTLWSVAAHLPGIGAEAAAFSAATAAVDEITHDVLPPLTDVVEVLTTDALRTVDGAVDLESLETAAPSAEAAAVALAGVRERLDPIDTDAILPALARPVVLLQDKAAALGETVDTAHHVTALLPPMLGAAEPRRYLLLTPTNAEPRSSIGVPGAVLVLEADDGRLGLGGRAGAGDVGPFDEPVLDLDPADAELYTSLLGQDLREATRTPDFPTAARLAARMWHEETGEEVDGVVAIDTVALASLLELTGPVRVGGTDVDAGSATETLLSQAYARLDAPENVDALTALVTGTVLATLLSGDTDVSALQEPLARAVGERWLLAWSAHDAEQSLFDAAVVAGGFHTSAHAAADHGVFLDDTGGTRMGYHLEAGVDVVASVCTDDGRLDTVELRLASTAPEDAASSLPGSMTRSRGTFDSTGEDTVDAPERGVVRTDVSVFGPRDGQVLELRRDGVEVGDAGRRASAHGRDVVVVTQDLAPGESVTIEARVLVPAARAGADVDVWSTPTATGGGLLTVGTPRCG